MFYKFIKLKRTAIINIRQLSPEKHDFNNILNHKAIEFSIAWAKKGSTNMNCKITYCLRLSFFETKKQT